MTLDTVAKVSAAYILTILVSAGGFTLWEGLQPHGIGTTNTAAMSYVSDR
ncbi:hypothetical protein [Ciceribacter selenitireducens]|jgi:hypothetical protein|uniref:Uncharacterized protein n=1 Tax=Ciceribacter selenitireducens ATCC BAA-1503 TaxID=1336235 RepID=A0A376AG20_9HYPH|nr:hypothetical protein [Ciceribacter selenitireducens]SSC66728.1 unnamed protein product [Ciceribacter selenitireducens ATCC BAA-1503]